MILPAILEPGLTGLPGLPGLSDGTKIPIWVNFRGTKNGKCWYSLWQLGLYYDHLI
jgi:hypothetical protein